MRDDEHYYRGPDNERHNSKIRPASFFTRNRVMVTLLTILAVLVVIFASTTFYLLSQHNQGSTTTQTKTVLVSQDTPVTQATSLPTATPTSTMSLSATATTSPQQPANPLTPTSTNYQFICISSCGDKLDVVLSTINLNTTNQTMSWNFTITDDGSICNYMSGKLSLTAPSGDKLSADGGTFVDNISMNAGQTLPRTATFSSIPQKGTQYTVTLSMNCSEYPTYQSVLFSY